MAEKVKRRRLLIKLSLMSVNSSREKQIREDVTDFYNDIAKQFSQTRKNWWGGLGFIKKYINSKDNLLDFGCGNGRLLEFIYGENLDINYTGVDISKELIEIAKGHYRDEKFLVIEDERKTLFKKEQFDIVMSIAVFHHFTPDMADNALKEMQRILKKDGIVIITAWHLWNKKRLPFLWKSFWRGLFRLDFQWVAKLPFSYSDKEKGQKTYWRDCYWWSKRGLEKIAQKNGFEILESGYSRDERNNKRNIYLVLKK